MGHMTRTYKMFRRGDNYSFVEINTIVDIPYVRKGQN